MANIKNQPHLRVQIPNTVLKKSIVEGNYSIVPHEIN